MADDPTTEPVLPAKTSHTGRNVLIALAIAILAALAVLLIVNLNSDDGTPVASPSPTDSASPTQAEPTESESPEPSPTEIERVTVRIGTTDISQPHWEILKGLAEPEGIDLEFVGFSEYTQPNPALAQGEIELNSFQHILYLADHNNNTGDDLQPIGSTLIVPLPLYSNQYTTVEEFQPGDEIAIPNDATNQGRALFVLEAAGLISFTGEPRIPTPDDIDTANSTVIVQPVEASQTATLINQLAGVIVNNNFAQDAGFDLASYVYADDPSSPGAQPYINVFASRAEDVDNPVYNRIVELYHDPAVLEAVVASSGGTAVIVEGYDGPRLREVLAEVEDILTEAAS